MSSNRLSKVHGLSTHAVLCVGVNGACLVAWLMASRTNACAQNSSGTHANSQKAIHYISEL